MEHEGRHAGLSATIAQDAVTRAWHQPRDVAVQILTTAVNVTDPSRNEELDGREGFIDLTVKDGSVVGWTTRGARANYRTGEAFEPTIEVLP